MIVFPASQGVALDLLLIDELLLVVWISGST